jgi:hypothetical protein
MPIKIVIEILTKKDCCLCDKIKEVANKVLPDYPARLIITDIESDPILYEKFKERIPILKINDIESFVYKVHETSLRRKLDQLK